MKIKFLKPWQKYSENDEIDTDIEKIPQKTADSLIKFDYAKDTSGEPGQDANNQGKAKNGK